jgi:site-specific DNA-methyltransferase (adenine-specific)
LREGFYSPAVPGRAAGLFIGGDVEFTNEDCMELMSRYPDKAFDLAITDPPYGIGISGKNPIQNKSDVKDFNTSWDKLPDKKYFDELLRVSKNQIIWGGNYFLDFLGFCKAPIIWDKLNGNSMYADGEFAWTGGDEMPRNLKIWKHQWCGAFKASERKNINIHPTQKPIALYKWLLTKYARLGWLILDTHVGSASSLIACEDLGFDYVGCELDADYYRAACERIENYRAQPKLFDCKTDYNQPELQEEHDER